MTEEAPLAIPRNPAQIPASQFRLSRNLKVRGDAIYIIFGGIIGAVFLFFALMDVYWPSPYHGFHWRYPSGSISDSSGRSRATISTTGSTACSERLCGLTPERQSA